MEVERPRSTDGNITSKSSTVDALCQPYIEKICSREFMEVLEGIKEIKNLVIGNTRRKTQFIGSLAPGRLIDLIQKADVPLPIKLQATIVLGSLAKGFDTNADYQLNHSIVETVCNRLSTENQEFYEATIRCLRTVIAISNTARNIALPEFASVVPLLIQNMNRSTCTQEFTCEILQSYCTSQEKQAHLLGFGILSTLANLLEASPGRVKIKALSTLSSVCYKNYAACEKCQCIHTGISEKSMIQTLIGLLAQREPTEIQLHSARCLTYMFRVGVLSLTSFEGVIIKKVVPCLVRMCDPNRSFQERVCGAETVAYLTEVDPCLQRLSYICEQFPLKLEAYLKHPLNQESKDVAEGTKSKDAIKYEQGLTAAGLLAYASLLSNDEDIRKQVATEILVSVVAETVMSPSPATRVAALKCLLSLSRSIHLLRTMIEDAGVWKVILKLLHEPNNNMEETKVLSSIMCNMTLDVSPSKNEFRSVELLSILVKWINVDELKLNSVWCLMNMSFQAQASLKLEILHEIGFDVVRSLTTDGDCIVILRTLGLLRNICHNGDEKILSCHGIDVIHTCKHVLTTFETAGIGDPTTSVHYESIRAHTVCILSCLASIEEPSFVQECLDSESDLIRMIISFLSHFDYDLQLATVTFLNNFVSNRAAQTDNRLSVLLENGALTGLGQLHSTNCGLLYGKVEDTMQLLHTKQCE